MRLIIWVLWPAFVAAGIAEVVFFTLIDPQQLYLLGRPLAVAPLTAYSIGFLLFWAVCAGASLLTYFMLPAEVKTLLARHASEHPDLARKPPRRSAA